MVNSASHPNHNHGHHGHPAHLSPGGSGSGRSPAVGSVVGSTQHLGQPLYQEYAHVRSRVPPPVYVTAAPSQEFNCNPATTNAFLPGIHIW
ncbi:hypothetical protein KQX54_000597, partial [Cotesia glomerata]